MTAKRMVALAAAAAAGIGAGCVQYQYNALAVSMEASRHADPPFPASIRQKVYVFLMNGLDPLDSTGVTRVRDGIVAAGYPKVYSAQRMDLAWYEREVRRVPRADPHARVVLVGLGAAAEPLLKLAAGAAADDVPIDAVVLLDPSWSTGTPPPAPYRTVVVRSRNWKASPGLCGGEIETVVLDDVRHVHVSKSLEALDAVLGVVAASAAKVVPEGDLLPSIPLQDKPNPTPRGDPPVILDPLDEWDFLKAPPKGGVPAAPPDPPTGYVPRGPVVPPADEPPPGDWLPPPRPDTPEQLPTPRKVSFAPGAVAR